MTIDINYKTTPYLILRYEHWTSLDQIKHYNRFHKKTLPVNLTFFIRSRRSRILVIFNELNCDFWGGDSKWNRKVREELMVETRFTLCSIPTNWLRTGKKRKGRNNSINNSWTVSVTPMSSLILSVSGNGPPIMTTLFISFPQTYSLIHFPPCQKFNPPGLSRTPSTVNAFLDFLHP